jgi:hypothetical protein
MTKAGDGDFGRSVAEAVVQLMTETDLDLLRYRWTPPILVKRHAKGALTQSRWRRGRLDERDRGALTCDTDQCRQNRLAVF